MCGNLLRGISAPKVVALPAVESVAAIRVENRVIAHRIRSAAGNVDHSHASWSRVWCSPSILSHRSSRAATRRYVSVGERRHPRNSVVEGARGEWFLILVVANDSYSSKNGLSAGQGGEMSQRTQLEGANAVRFWGCDVDSSVPLGSIERSHPTFKKSFVCSNDLS